MSIDNDSAQECLRTAYQLLMEFQDVINDQLEGQHQMAEAVDRWLTWYEKEVEK